MKCFCQRSPGLHGSPALRVLVLLAAGAMGRALAGADPVDFRRDVEPILKSRCQGCHGEAKQKGDLRLDRKESAFRAGAEGHAAIVPGKSAESKLIEKVTSTDPDAVMPPKGERLTADQISVLRRWIDAGADWPPAEGATKKQHWSFRAPERPAEPDVSRKEWSRNPIDRFILKRLEAEKLEPSPEADRLTLMRRASFDLVGLPPSIEEVDAYLADGSRDAYAKLVERLLDSPHHGERWGRHWLDAARYADSDGFEKDKLRRIWSYRDWVIDALNRDLPYDQFLVEQVAGDLLPNPTQAQLVATGFLRNAMLNEEGGIDPEQFRMDAMYDRMDCIGKSVLGLTIQCAQCHTHKFDPLTQEEYYRLFAFLNNDHESCITVYSEAQQSNRSRLMETMRDIEEGLRRASPDWEARMALWEDDTRAHETPWVVLDARHAGDNGERFIPQKDGSLLHLGYAPTQYNPPFEARVALPRITAFRLELLRDPNLPVGGPGRSLKGLCALTEFTVQAVDAQDASKKVDVKIARATADFANPEQPLEDEFDDKSGKPRKTGPISFAIDGKDDTAWGIDAGPGRRNEDRKAVFVAEKPVEMPGGTVLTIHLKQEHGGWNSDDNQSNNIGRFRLSVTSAENPTADPMPKRLRELLAVPRANRSAAQQAALFSFWRTTVPDFREANEKIESLWREWPEGVATLVLASRDDGRDTRVLKRGDWLQPGKQVTPGVPAFLHQISDGFEPSRLTFARWLSDPRSPTTARVIVNRIWQAYFGVGLVDTPEDFGMQGTAPSHPELLDWLATELMEPATPAGMEGASKPAAKPWSLKHIHRLIATSAAYRQQSRVTPEALARDPYNRLLARGPRVRVEGEIVRDIALSASGLLDPGMGGPGIFSPAPPVLFMPPNSYGPFNWIEATGGDRYRRAIYTFRRRSTPYPMLANFDAPNGDFSCVRRTRTNTPMQALTTLNEPVFMEAGRALARRALAEGGKTDRERVAYAFRRVLSRPPEEDETYELLSLIDRTKRRVADGWINAAELGTGVNEVPPSLPPGATPADLAAYTAVSRVLLNLDEAITKE